MRFLASLFLLLISLAANAQLAPPTPAVTARSWLLEDLGSNQELATGNPDARSEPASLTKLMTGYVSFAALKQGIIKRDQVIPVSVHAWKAQGSRMFIDMKKPVTVDELLKGMIVQSGNDASIALAEAIGGTEDGFALMMNREAQRLGMKNTHFVNATGLPDPQHYTTARDLALLTAALIRDYPEYFPIFLMQKYTYNGITQDNRNGLLKLDPHVDFGKTGHTDSAGYCLIASAKHGERRLVSVVMGTDSATARERESLKLLNFGFQYYDTVRLYGANQAVAEIPVYKGARRSVKIGFTHDFVLSVPKGQAALVSQPLGAPAAPPQAFKVQLTTKQPLLAPIAPGQQMGTMKLMLNDKLYGEYPVVALEDVPLAGIVGRAWDTLRLWFE